MSIITIEIKVPENVKEVFIFKFSFSGYWLKQKEDTGNINNWDKFICSSNIKIPVIQSFKDGICIIKLTDLPKN